jgi:hypothetical protein
MSFNATVICYCAVPSASNLREHWAVRARRVRSQRSAAVIALTRSEQARYVVDELRDMLPHATVHVTLERMGVRKLDDDNLRGALKAFRDGVADVLDLDDGDERIEWIYSQCKAVRTGVRIGLDVREVV